MSNECQKPNHTTSISDKIKDISYRRAKGAAYKSAALKALEKNNLSFIRELIGVSDTLPTLSKFEKTIGYYTIESDIMIASQVAYDIGYDSEHIQKIKRNIYTKLKIK